MLHKNALRLHNKSTLKTLFFFHNSVRILQLSNFYSGYTPRSLLMKHSYSFLKGLVAKT